MRSLVTSLPYSAAAEEKRATRATNARATNSLTCPRSQIKITARCLTLNLSLAKPYLTITSLRSSAGAAWVWSTRPRMHAYTGLWH